MGWLLEESVEIIAPVYNAAMEFQAGVDDATERAKKSGQKKQRSVVEQHAAVIMWDALVSSLSEYLQTPSNYFDILSSVIAIIAMTYALSVDSEGPSEANYSAGPVFLSIASILSWMRLFDLIRAIPGLGFYPHLIDEVFKDLIPFTIILVRFVYQCGTLSSSTSCSLPPLLFSLSLSR